MCIRPTQPPPLVEVVESDPPECWSNPPGALVRAWTHQVNTVGGAFWCYAASLDQALRIANGAVDRVVALREPIVLR
ncbi:MAG: hypothetical protein ACK4MI_03925 [Brevundimonas sp.]|uniref:hypothetical protein n=1 Tax=Brevundimonas sp. TaxID=1871086 RepID=UPI00391A27B8